jgi:outer membrane protein OmpA-like peptidoglycan-associated protein
MKILPLVAAMAFACSFAVPEAAAQERGYRHGGVQKHYRGGGYRHGGHHRHRYGPRVQWSAPYYRPYYGSYGYWAAPAFAYPYPIYEPAPVVVERVYEEPRYYYEEPRYYEPPRAERPEPYPERPRAEARPSRPAPQVAAIPEPRLERYTLSAKELFEFDKSTLRMPQPKLDEIADVLKKHPQIGDVDITGHTDRLGSEAYNMALSKRRADAVKGYLVNKGVESRRLRAVAKGESSPVVQCDDKDTGGLIKCLEPNRRVEVESITVERRVPARS